MIRPPLRSTRAVTRFPCTTLFRSRDPVTAADAAIALGVDRVLSSGGAPTAIEGIETLQAMRARAGGAIRSEEHTSELQSLMRISYAVFCLKKKNPEDM